jgi:hypothetical protein
MEKLLAMQVAAMLTNAVLEGVGGTALSDYPVTVNQDGTVTVKPSAAAQSRNYVVWETFRTFYWAIIGADKDSKNWPDPPASQGQTSISGVMGELAPLASAIGAPGGLASLAPQILQAAQSFLKNTQSMSSPGTPLPPLATPGK